MLEEEKMVNEIKETLERLNSVRISNGKCAFCGEEINVGQYCECRESEKANKVTQKIVNGIFDSYITNLQLHGKKGGRTAKIFNNVPEIFSHCTWSDYKTISLRHEECRNAVFEYFAKTIEHYINGTNLFLLGNYGTGKTMLMSILANEIALNYASDVKFIGAVALFNLIKETFNHKDLSPEMVLKRYKKCDFLFLDDLDKLKPSEYVSEQIYALVNYRVERGLPIIVSANSTLEELDEKYFGEATVSRLVDKNKSIVVNFVQDNWRLTECVKI